MPVAVGVARRAAVVLDRERDRPVLGGDGEPDRTRAGLDVAERLARRLDDEARAVVGQPAGRRGDRDLDAAGAQRRGKRRERALEVRLRRVLGLPVGEQLAHDRHRAAADGGAAAQQPAQVGLLTLLGWGDRGRLQLIGDAGELLHDAAVDLGGDPPALALQVALGAAREPLALGRLGAPATGVVPAERQLRGGERDQQRDGHREDRAPDAAGRGVDAARRVVGLDDHAAPVGEPQRQVDLNEPPAAALEAVLGAGEVADVGAHRVVVERLAEVGGQREPPADQRGGVRVDNPPGGGPDLHADDRPAEHALAHGAVELTQGMRVAIQRRRRDVLAQHALAVGDRDRARVLQRLAGGDAFEQDGADRRDDREQHGAGHGELDERRVASRSERLHRVLPGISVHVGERARRIIVPRQSMPQWDFRPRTIPVCERRRPGRVYPVPAVGTPGDGSRRYARWNWPTSCSSCSAVRASSWADAAICCVEALVCCVEADTCSEDAEDCSATAATSVMSACTCCELEAICSIAAAICSTRPFMSCTDAPSVRKASRASSTVATPSLVRSAPSSTTATARLVSAWISAISEAIEPAAACDSSASLRTSSATTAKPRPCSPARAASMAAFSASRFVCSAMPVIVATMPSICSDFAPSSRMASVACTELSRTAPMASEAWATAPAPRSATSRAAIAAAVVSCALPVLMALAVATSSEATFACSTARTWRSAPSATSLTAEAISPTARPASSDVVAICCDAAETLPADDETSPIRAARLLRLSVYADRDSTVFVRISLNARATSPTSSRPGFSISGVSGSAATVRSPWASAGMPAFMRVTQTSRSIARRSTTTRSGGTTRRVMRNAVPRAASSPGSAASMPTRRAEPSAALACATSCSRCVAT